MLLRKFLLLLLFLPGVVLGPGWDLRICPQAVLGTAGCCNPESVTSCCAEEPSSPSHPVAEDASTCAACCLYIETPAEQPLPASGQLAEHMNRAQEAALVCSLQAPPPGRSELAPLLWSELEPAPPGRRTPLPLRI